MRAAGDPFVELRVMTYRAAFFRLAGTVKVHADYETDKVLAAVETALREAFHFCCALVQSAGDVERSDSRRFKPCRASLRSMSINFIAAAAPRLCSNGCWRNRPMTLPNGQLAAAELLTLDPAPLDQLGVMA